MGSRKIVVGLVFLVWLVQMILASIFSHSASFWGRKLPSIILNYGNFLTMHTNWNFYSPDPAQVMFVKFKIRDEEGELVATGTWPFAGSKIMTGSSLRRTFYYLRGILFSPNGWVQTLAPWLCHRYGADSVSIQPIFYEVKSFDEFLLVSSKGSSLIKQVKQGSISHYKCQP